MCDVTFSQRPPSLSGNTHDVGLLRAPNERVSQTLGGEVLAWGGTSFSFVEASSTGSRQHFLASLVSVKRTSGLSLWPACVRLPPSFHSLLAGEPLVCIHMLMSSAVPDGLARVNCRQFVPARKLPTGALVCRQSFQASFVCDGEGICYSVCVYTCARTCVCRSMRVRASEKQRERERVGAGG